MKEIDSAVKEILKIYGLSGLIPDEQKPDLLHILLRLLVISPSTVLA